MEMITKDEFKELLSVLNYYMIGGLMMGIMCATVAAYGGIVLVRVDYGLPTAKVITASIVILIGAMTGFLAYLVLLPAELKLVRIKLKPILLARKLSRKK